MKKLTIFGLVLLSFNALSVSCSELQAQLQTERTELAALVQELDNYEQGLFRFLDDPTRLEFHLSALQELRTHEQSQRNSVKRNLAKIKTCARN